MTGPEPHNFPPPTLPRVESSYEVPAGDAGSSQTEAGLDRLPIDVAALPPWTCCGARGHHATDCCIYYTPDGDLP